MTETAAPSPSDAQDGNDLSDGDLPPGDHALEIAARRGIGPLSILAREVWHGQAMPCVSCGQLVRRDAGDCEHCGQDLSAEMLEKMLAHAGPWYVHEHIRPFPGVTLERIIRQIRRGVITETSILRGPETNHRWRFAVETPGLCRFFNTCWRCQERVEPIDANCRTCRAPLEFGVHPGIPHPSEAGESQQSDSEPGIRPASAPGANPEEPSAASADTKPESASTREPAASAIPSPISRNTAFVPAFSPEAKPPTAEELKGLTAALKNAPAPVHDPDLTSVPRIFGIRATWIAIALLLALIAVLILLSERRNRSLPTRHAEVAASVQCCDTANSRDETTG